MDPFGYPYVEQNANPPGFDVEILQAIADKYDMRVECIGPTHRLGVECREL